jgi:hypothetical protein
LLTGLDFNEQIFYSNWPDKLMHGFD